MTGPLARRLLSGLIGSALLVAIVIGSGIAAPTPCPETPSPPTC
ncbi:MAG TPA: hypothetical protein VEK76_04605 [Candidatus Binatia bacterium]|nr:hypothetical protein [Candidatus Binatia bacterium]